VNEFTGRELFFALPRPGPRSALGNLGRGLLSHGDRAEIWGSCAESAERCDEQMGKTANAGFSGGIVQIGKTVLQAFVWVD
jgi:hypothetical protein